MENTTSYISEAQLTKLVGQQKELQALLTNIGVVESQKHGLLHNLAEVNKIAEEFKKELESIYGAISINLETGEYAKIEKNDVQDN
jgi:predicted  nucleic acid-binding Zn-ribbon protein